MIVGPNGELFANFSFFSANIILTTFILFSKCVPRRIRKDFNPARYGRPLAHHTWPNRAPSAVPEGPDIFAPGALHVLRLFA